MLKEEEIDLLLVDLLELYGYDFNYYSRESLQRRISRIFRLEKFASFADFHHKIKSDSSYIEHLVDRITVNVTEMFRDVDFFRELRMRIVPSLNDLPQIRIWHAGCSSGEEVYSMAILLHEAGLLEKTHIIATDINSMVIEKAKKATYPLSLIQLYSRNYSNSGGTNDFSSYLDYGTNSATFKPFLTNKITFDSHNLASGIFINKFNCVVCRNVVIYFDNELRERVFELFDLSLFPNSYLALGEKETLKSSKISGKFIQESKEKIWKKTS
jgi:chemotaxis protein methyltransferase CheR